MKLITLFLILFGLAVSAIPVDVMDPTASALQPRMTGCQNAQCWDYQSNCNIKQVAVVQTATRGDSVPDKTLQEFIGAFNNKWNSHALSAGTNMTLDIDRDGVHGFLAVRNYNGAGSGSWLMDTDLIYTGFGDVLKNCEPGGAGTPSKGGYIWLPYKGLTFVIGVNGNQPTTFCNVFWVDFC